MFGSLYPGDFPERIMPGRRIPFVEYFKSAIGELPEDHILATRCYDYSSSDICLMKRTHSPPDTRLGYSIADAKDLIGMGYEIVFIHPISGISFDKLVSVFQGAVQKVQKIRRREI